MNSEIEYNFFDFLKSEELPSIYEVLGHLVQGITPVLVLDSCICLDIINYIDGKKTDNNTAKKVINLFEYAGNSKIDILGSFGVLELSHNRNNYSINVNKFSDFGNKIEFAIHLPIQKLKARDFSSFVKKEITSKEDIFPLAPILNNTYCSLLKIRELRNNNPKKTNATSNFLDFLRWLETDLDIILSTEIELAKLIFAGENNFLPMIGLKSDKTLAKRQLWGTAWDIMHYRINTQYSSTIPLNGIQNKPYFVTNDKNLIKLSKRLTNKAVVKSGNEIHGAFVYSEFEFPCYEKDWDMINLKMNELNIRRRQKILNEPKPKKDVLKLIKELELKNGIA